MSARWSGSRPIWLESQSPAPARGFFVGGCATKAATLTGRPETAWERRKWCPWPGSNQHSLRNSILSRARLPVPPQGPRLGVTPCGGADHSQGRLRVNRQNRGLPGYFQGLPAGAAPPWGQGRGNGAISSRGACRRRPVHVRSPPPPDTLSAPGEVAEWSNAPHSKCGIPATVSGVRIPPSPPPCFALRASQDWQTHFSEAGCPPEL